MSNQDDMREIEAALDSFAEAAVQEFRSGVIEDMRAFHTKRQTVLALIRAKLPAPAGSIGISRGEFDVDLHNDGSGTVAWLHFTVTWKESGRVDKFVPVTADAEHEAKVEAWRKMATSEPDGSCFRLMATEIDDALRLMRARPARVAP